MREGSWFNEGACHMNTATHAVEVPFPQAFASPKRSPFPSAPRYGTEPGLPGLSEALMRSNQTARCDECASPQTWRESSRCCLALCELAMCSAFILSSLSRLSLNNSDMNTQYVSIPPSPPKKGTPIHPPLGKMRAFWAVFCKCCDLSSLSLTAHRCRDIVAM